MKFTWGTGILVFLIVFLIACGVFMWFAFSQKLNLVEKDYYEKGVNHSLQMKIEQRSSKFINQININENQNKIIIFFPDNFSSTLKEGNILFFRPSDNYKDNLYQMDLENNKQEFFKEDFITGRYLIKISWLSDEEYYIEKEFFVQ